MFFGNWALQGDGRLTGGGTVVQLPPKESRVLRLLLASANRLLSKDHLLEQAWPRGDAAEESLTRCICSLRRYLKADKGYIKTVYGRGYRFICPVVSEVGGDDALPSVAYVCAACGRERV
ncbi:MAG: Transcriptional regulator HilA [Pseudomonas sp.]|nr:MAG: Transcriptional regulator HilA [Pseudomonas sp.]